MQTIRTDLLFDAFFRQFDRRKLLPDFLNIKSILWWVQNKNWTIQKAGLGTEPNADFWPLNAHSQSVSLGTQFSFEEFVVADKLSFLPVRDRLRFALGVPPTFDDSLWDSCDKEES